MALLCNDCTIVGKTKQIWCDLTGKPCLHVRYCAVSSKYYQTDASAKCKIRRQYEQRQNNATDENNRI